MINTVISNRMIEILKTLPIDLGQGHMGKKTKGKSIGFEIIKINAQGGCALDLGCREGHQSRRLERLGYYVVSVDIIKRYKNAILVDANKGLPFKNETFDLVWCSEVIEHLTDVHRTINELKRVLKTGGHAVITTPNSYFWLMNLLTLFKLTPAKLQRKDHLHFFKMSDIKILFPKARVYGFFPYLILKFKIERFVGLLSPTFIIHLKKEIG
jgi:SAM-dependent methyltransferase